MANIIDYIKWRGDITFEKSELNDLDIVCFSQLAMIDFLNVIPNFNQKKQISLKESASIYFSYDSNKSKYIGLIIPSCCIELYKEMAESNRFCDLLLSDYINDVEETKEIQISALTVEINKNLHIIVFSGTDDTLVGWKENLNMIFEKSIPAQKAAINYVNTIMNKYRGNFIICGHSKGGNMSILGTIGAEKKNQDRIIKSYNIDGPGVNLETFNSKNYKDHIKKAVEILPVSSTVGRLFNHAEEKIIVKSSKEGFYQHDCFSWEVLGTSFLKEESLSIQSDSFINTLNSILDSMDTDARISFVNSTYEMLTSTGAKSLTDLMYKKNDIIKSYLSTSIETKKKMSGPLLHLFKDKYIRQALYSSIKEFNIQRRENNE